MAELTKEQIEKEHAEKLFFKAEMTFVLIWDGCWLIGALIGFLCPAQPGIMERLHTAVALSLVGAFCGLLIAPIAGLIFKQGRRAIW